MAVSGGRLAKGSLEGWKVGRRRRWILSLRSGLAVGTLESLASVCTFGMTISVVSCKFDADNMDFVETEH